MNYLEMTPIQLDALKEVGNIGAGNAATALSQLLSRKVDMTVPSVNILPFNEVFTSNGIEKIVIGIIVRVLGDTPGNILFIIDKKTAFEIIKSLTGEEAERLTDMGQSVLCEIGNIIASSYMNTISKITNLIINLSVPAVCHDMLGAILSTTFIESGQFDEQVLDLETNFLKDEKEDTKGHFYYIPMPGSLEKILNTLGVN